MQELGNTKSRHREKREDGVKLEKKAGRKGGEEGQRWWRVFRRW